MSKTSLTVPVAEAKRSFSKLLRAAREGERITITSYGKPVAELGPARNHAENVERLRREVHDRLMKRLRSQTAVPVGPWTRQELYEPD